MENKTKMPNADNKFRLVQERLEIFKVHTLPNIVVANHSLISLRETATIYVLNAIQIAATQLNLDIDIYGDQIVYEEGHLERARNFIEYSILKN